MAASFEPVELETKEPNEFVGHMRETIARYEATMRMISEMAHFGRQFKGMKEQERAADAVAQLFIILEFVLARAGRPCSGHTVEQFGEGARAWLCDDRNGLHGASANCYSQFDRAPKDENDELRIATAHSISDYFVNLADFTLAGMAARVRKK